MSNHTPAPWTAERDPCHYDTLSSIRGGLGARCDLLRRMTPDAIRIPTA